jgi:hypothetical protein
MHFGENQLSPLSIGISPRPTAHPSGLQSTPVRASTSCYGRFTLAMGSSSGFGSTPGDMRAVHTRFRCGSACHWLNRPPRVTRRIILQKARRQPAGPKLGLGLRLHVSNGFQDLFHSPRRGTFHRSLTVLCAIGRCVYVALGSGLPSFTPDCSCPALLKHHPSPHPHPADPALTVSGDAFQTSWVDGCWGTGRRQPSLGGLSTPLAQRLPACHATGLGSPRFARRYYGDTLCSSGYMRCFSSPGSLRPSINSGRSPPLVVGLPHSEIGGSTPARDSPPLIAAMPRPSSARSAKASPRCSLCLPGRNSTPATGARSTPPARHGGAQRGSAQRFALGKVHRLRLSAAGGPSPLNRAEGAALLARAAAFCGSLERR